MEPIDTRGADAKSKEEAEMGSNEIRRKEAWKEGRGNPE
jgi:ribosomal protein S8